MECSVPMYLPERDVTVPCGRCVFCMATRRSDWSTRLYYESRQHFNSKFITLTYANPHLTFKQGNSQLVKSDLQKFFKRLRKAGYSLRYFACGEYGSRTFRPHYHVLLFCDIGEYAIRKAWPLGQVHVGQITQASIMYCLGYIVNGKGWKMKHHRQPPFNTMSRKPGLGANYLTPAMIRWHQDSRKNYVLVDGQKRHLPRYYKGKIFSKLDQVRIAVRDQKASFKRQVQWIRSPSARRLADPIGYREEQMRRLAHTIRAKCKINLTI